MKFTVDSKTEVIARGGSTATRKAQAEGKPGAPITEVIKAGQTVEVRYREQGMLATSIRALAAGTKPSTSDDEPKAPKSMTSSGVVASVTGTSLAVKGTGGEMTFVVDEKTNVIGTGVGTKARAQKAQGEKTVITDFVSVGDRVTVTYHDMAGTKHAGEVRITRKATAK
jgi:hypothetical protein